MEVQTAYCSALDRQVEVVPLSEFPAEARPADYPEDTLICLDYGAYCTGSMCPLFRIPTSEMKELLAAAGILEEDPSAAAPGA